VANQWLYARDQITINSDLAGIVAGQAQLPATSGGLSPGDTVVFAARQCTQDPTFVWDGSYVPASGPIVPLPFNVVVIADSYLTGSGSGPGGINLSGATGPAGQTGAAGRNGSAGIPATPGGPGGPGGLGGAGAPPVGTITIIAGTLDPVPLTAAGGPGGPGGVGGHGGAPAPPHTINSPTNPKYSPGAPGGAGGNGGNGGQGATGGTIAVQYVTAGPGGTPQVAATAVAGGAGGTAGAGGAGGGVFLGKAAPAGSPGAAGPAGAGGHQTVSEITESGYWNAAMAVLTPANLQAWVSYRLTVGTYFYRTFNASDPAHSGDLLTAYNEFLAVQSLGVAATAAQTAQAAQLASWVDNNLNALGLPYDTWIKPDFESFEQVYVGYLPTLQEDLEEVNTLVTNANTDSSVKPVLSVMLADATNEQTALQADLTYANQVVTDDQGLLAGLNQQMNALNVQIGNAQQALNEAEYEFDETKGLTMAWDVIQAVVTLAPLVGPVLGVAGIVVPSWSTLSAASLGSQGMSGKGAASPLASGAGGLSALVGKSSQIVGLFQSLTENTNSTITQDQQAIQQLTAQALNLQFQILRQQDQLTEAQLNVAAVQAHINACAADISAIAGANNAVTSGMAEIAGLVSELMATIARMSEYVLKYVFLAARALDIFSFNDGVVVAPAGAAPQPMCNVYQLALDFGVVAPDTLAAALLELEQGSATAAIDLTATLAENWSQTTQWTTYDDQGTALAEALSPGSFWVAVTDPTAVSTLAGTGSTSFQITLADLPADSYELKITQMWVNLLGATATVPSLSGTLTHAGYAQALRADGATLLLGSQPMTSFASVGLASGAVPPDVSPVAPAPAATAAAAVPATATTTTTTDASLPTFYGRSPATTWTFALDDATSADLTGLTQFQVGIEFLAVAG
jgi:peptidoglycan hydrolase CwlO-like protein